MMPLKVMLNASMSTVDGATMSMKLVIVRSAPAAIVPPASVSRPLPSAPPPLNTMVPWLCLTPPAKLLLADMLIDPGPFLVSEPLVMLAWS